MAALRTPLVDTLDAIAGDASADCLALVLGAVRCMGGEPPYTAWPPPFNDSRSRVRVARELYRTVDNAMFLALDAWPCLERVHRAPAVAGLACAEYPREPGMIVMAGPRPRLMWAGEPLQAGHAVMGVIGPDATFLAIAPPPRGLVEVASRASAAWRVRPCP